MSKLVCQSSYLAEAVTHGGSKLIVATMLKLLKETKVEFDTIVWRGMSGALIAPVVAHVLGKEMLMVRKGESCHSCNRVEGNIGTEKFIVIDDLISEGGTMRAIFEGIYRSIADTATCQGIFLYSSCDSDITQFIKYPARNGEVTAQVMAYSFRIDAWESGKKYVRWYRGISS